MNARKFILGAVTVSLAWLFILPYAAHAAMMASYWVAQGSYSSIVTQSPVEDVNRQCHPVPVSVKVPGQLTRVETKCVLMAKWGALSSDGLMRIGENGSLARVDLGLGRTALVTPGVDGLYLRGE